MRASATWVSIAAIFRFPINFSAAARPPLTPKLTTPLTIAEAKAKLSEVGLKANITGQQTETITIQDQIPKPNVEVLENSTVILYTETGIDKVTVTVPNVYGKTPSEATTILKNVGLNINIEGLGTADSQSPAAGVQAERGSIVNVNFKITEVD